MFKTDLDGQANRSLYISIAEGPHHAPHGIQVQKPPFLRHLPCMDDLPRAQGDATPLPTTLRQLYLLEHLTSEPLQGPQSTCCQIQVLTA